MPLAAPVMTATLPANSMEAPEDVLVAMQHFTILQCNTTAKM
jgi:hypothetical protein